MDETAPVASQPSQWPALAEKAKIGWGWFILQLVVVAIIYLLVSFAFVVPAVLDAMETGSTEQPDLGSALVAWSAIASMFVAIGVACLFLRREGRVREAIRLERPREWGNTLLWAAIGLVGTLTIFFVGAPLMEAIGLDAPDAGFVLELVTESPALFALWVIGVAWLAAGFGEEVLYRGWLTDRLERLPGLSGKLWPVILIQAVLFGLPHAYQGLGGMIVTGLVGVLFGWIRLRQGGNLWAVILAHAAVDTVVMAMAYMEKLGWIAM